MKIKVGSQIGQFRIGRIVCEDYARTEYEAFPLDDAQTLEYRAVEYDLCLLRAQDSDDPIEFRFLEEASLESFPTIVDGGRDEQSAWAILHLQGCPTVWEWVQRGAVECDKALDTAISLCSCILSIHSYDPSLCHFNISPETVRVDLGNDTPRAYLDGLGRMSVEALCSGYPYTITDMSYYTAPEAFIGRWSEKADVYSISLILYMLLTGNEYPWTRDPNLLESVEENRCDKTQFVLRMGHIWNSAPDLSPIRSAALREILLNGLSTNPKQRIGTVHELQKRLMEVQSTEKAIPGSKKRTIVRGFDAVAGMHGLKEMLTDKFILPVRNAELARAYGITPPNGCLLYGPPGCGKTFIIKRIAEEAGIPCHLFKPSDVASVYVHGAQQKIRELFDGAREQAPVIVCFDEADALFGDRSSHGREYLAGEVNEFLAQLNGLASEEIYLFLMTNYPEKIDPAILRTGRIDEKWYVPMPDEKAREEFFRLRFDSVPLSEDVDMGMLASLTEGRTFSDLEYIVTESCRRVFVSVIQQQDNGLLPVTMPVIRDVISCAPYSVSPEQLRRYEELQDRMKNRPFSKNRARIGFKFNLLE